MTFSIFGVSRVKLSRSCLTLRAHREFRISGHIPEATKVLIFYFVGNCPVFTSDGFLDWKECNSSASCPNNSFVSNEVYQCKVFFLYSCIPCIYVFTEFVFSLLKYHLRYTYICIRFYLQIRFALATITQEIKCRFSQCGMYNFKRKGFIIIIKCFITYIMFSIHIKYDMLCCIVILFYS